MDGDVPDDEQGTIETIAFLARSRTRVELLRTIREHDGRTHDALLAAFDADRTTITRNLDALAERGLVERRDRTCELTLSGETVLDSFEELVEAVGVTRRLRPFLQWVPREFSLDVQHLAGADLTTAGPGNPYAPVNRHVEALQRSDRVRLVMAVVGRDAMTVGIDRLTDDDVEMEVVLAGGAAEAVRSDPELSSQLEELIGAGADVFVTGESVPYYLGLYDGCVQIGVEDDEGVPRALVESEADPVRAWATDVYASYRADAERFS